MDNTTPYYLRDGITGKRRTYTEPQRQKAVAALEWETRAITTEYHMTEEQYEAIFGHPSPQEMRRRRREAVAEEREALRRKLASLRTEAERCTSAE